MFAIEQTAISKIDKKKKDNHNIEIRISKDVKYQVLYYVNTVLETQTLDYIWVGWDSSRLS